MSSDAFKQRENTLENMYFQQQEKKLIKKLKDQGKQEELKNDFLAVFDCSDDELISELDELDITLETLSMVTLAPCFLVAWADQVMEDNEKEKILEFFENEGLAGDSHARELLNSWLKSISHEQLFNAWEDYMNFMKDSLRDHIFSNLVKKTRKRCLEVAQASGGFLGLGSVSAEENKTLEKINHCLDQFK